MPDYSHYGIPRPIEIGREVRLEQRRATNRAAIFAIAGVLVLCACICIAGGIGFYAWNGMGGSTAAFSLPSLGGPAPTPTEAGPTAVPFLKSAKNNAGLRLTVTAYQRPLPAEGLTIPSGQELALVSVRIDNTRTTGGPIQFSPDDFKLVSAEGDSFNADSGSVTTGEMLKAGEIEAGKSTKGDLVFYVYSDVKDLNLAWTSADGETLTFKLTR